MDFLGVSDEVYRLQREGSQLFVRFESETERGWEPARVADLATRFSSLAERCDAMLAEPDLSQADHSALLAQRSSARLHLGMCSWGTNPGPLERA